MFGDKFSTKIVETYIKEKEYFRIEKILLIKH